MGCSLFAQRSHMIPSVMILVSLPASTRTYHRSPRSRLLRLRRHRTCVTCRRRSATLQLQETSRTRPRVSTRAGPGMYATSQLKCVSLTRPATFLIFIRARPPAAVWKPRELSSCRDCEPIVRPPRETRCSVNTKCGILHGVRPGEMPIVWQTCRIFRPWDVLGQDYV